MMVCSTHILMVAMQWWRRGLERYARNADAVVEERVGEIRTECSGGGEGWRDTHGMQWWR
jgi:hypothetical protein